MPAAEPPLVDLIRNLWRAAIAAKLGAAASPGLRIVARVRVGGPTAREDAATVAERKEG